MVEILLSRAIRVLCVSGVALGMNAAMAQENTDTLQQVDALHGERWVQTFTGIDDPESEVGNGLEPPHEANRLPELEVGSTRESSPPIYVDSETEIDDGNTPPV